MNSINRLITIALLAIALSACATPVVQQVPPAEMAKTHGHVQSLFGVPGILTVTSAQSGERYRIGQQGVGGVNGVLNGEWLPPGNYTATEWNGTDLKGYPQFEVAVGRVTNLGALVPFGVGDYEFVLLPVRHHVYETELDAAFPEEKKVLIGESIRWDVDEVPEPFRPDAGSTGLGLIADLLMAYDRKVNTPGLNKRLRDTNDPERFFELARTGAVPSMFEPAAGEDGTLFYGAALGQIRVRNPDGTWDSLDTGVLQRVTAFAVSDDTMLAGFGDGSLRLRNHDNVWRDVGAVPGHTILEIDRGLDGWFVVAAERMAKNHPLEYYGQASIFSLSDGSSKDLRELKSIEAEFDAGALRPLVRAEVVDQQYLLSVVYNLYRLDLESGEWSTLPVGGNLHGFHVSANDAAMSAFIAGGAFTKVYLSTDSGATWQRIKRPPYHVVDVNFLSETEARAIRLHSKAFTSQLEYYSFNIADNQWTMTHEAPKGCVRAFLDADGLGRFCSTASGSILARVDDEWVVEFSVE